MALLRKWFPLIAACLLLAGLTACSLAEDITPPPDYVPPTSAPTAQPTRVETLAPAAPVSTGQAPAGTGTPAAATVGLISGRVTNGSGGTIDTGLKVTLHGYDAMSEVVTQEAPVGTDGSYQFTGVEMPSGRVFMVTTEYKGASFSSDVAHPQDASQALDLPVTVYDTTTDTSALSVDRLHIFFDFSQPNILQVITLYVISNDGNATVVPPAADQPVLKFVLPAGATDLQFQTGQLGERYVQTPGGFGDTQPIPPGQAQYQVLYAYNLPYGGKIDLSIPTGMAVKSAILLVPGSGVKVDNTKLVESGTQDVQGTSYRLYSADNLSASSTLDLTLSGSPTQAAASGSFISSGTLGEILIGVAVFGLAILAALYWMYRVRPASQPAAAGSPALAERGETADELIDAIAALDDLHQAGQLPETAYQERRAELKERLRGLLT